MSLLFKIVLSVVLTFIVILSYVAIKDINTSNEFNSKDKNKWVFFILYFPIIGPLYYFYKKKTN